MKIKNETHWRTNQIAALIRRVAQDELDPGQSKSVRVYVDYRRSNGCAGHGRYGQSGLQPRLVMWLHLWKDKVDAVELAHTIAHEFAHNKGLRHREMMKGNRYGFTEGWRERYAYAKDFPISAQAEKPKPTLDDKRRKALAKAQSMVKKWERKLKLATTSLRKWKVRTKAAERRLAPILVHASASTSGCLDSQRMGPLPHRL